MRKLSKYTVLILSLCLFIGSFQTVYADESKVNKVKEPPTLGKVQIKSNVMAEVKNLQIMPTESNQIIGFTLAINNNSASEINFLDYWVNLTTKTGTKLNVQAVNKNIARIPAKSSQDISFYAYAGNNIKPSDLVIEVIQWDFSIASYTKILGKISVPQNYNPVTPQNNARIIASEDAQASFMIKQAVIGRSESYYRPDIKLVVRNEGKRSITLPDYQIYIMTADHLMYPVTATNMKETVLNPLTEKEFQLTVSIPKDVNESGWKLAVMNPVEEGKISFPLALFELPKSSTDVAEEVGKFYTFSTTQGIYNIKLDSLNRLPIEEDDLVVANMTIANKGNVTLPIPTISGKFIFNDSIEKDASSTNNNKIISIKPGAAINIQLVGRVPYTFDVSKIRLIVQQKETGTGTEQETRDLVEFTHSGVFDSIRRVNSNVGFQISDVGYRSEVKARNKLLFIGPSADIVAVQLTVKNNEKRSTDIQKFAGYFEKSDGTVYPATFENISDKIGPAGMAYIYVWASIPKETNISDLNLIVGKAITAETPSEPTSETVVGYADPYSFILPKELEPKNNIQNIEFPPYSLTVKQSDTKIDYAANIVRLKILYELIQDLSVKSDTKNDKIIIELKDPNYKTNFTKELSLPVGNTENSSEASLALGEHSLELSWTDENFVRQIQQLREYQLNVYLQKQPGYKALIATETIPWFIDRKLGEE